MTPNSTSNSSSIFKDGKLKPGIYKIQNLYTDTYLDIHRHSKEVCCRPAKDLEDGRDLWEIKQFGAGYTVQRVDPGKPEQFCTPVNGIKPGTALCVAAYPVAWRVETVDDGDHRGFEYIRFYWATGNTVWDLPWTDKPNGAPVHMHLVVSQHNWQIWRLIPVKVEGAFTPPRPSPETSESGPLPSYEGDTGQSSTRAQHMELGRDELGTVVNEVTVVTTTVTTHKRYRVEDA